RGGHRPRGGRRAGRRRVGRRAGAGPGRLRRCAPEAARRPDRGRTGRGADGRGRHGPASAPGGTRPRRRSPRHDRPALGRAACPGPGRPHPDPATGAPDPAGPARRSVPSRSRTARRPCPSVPSGGRMTTASPECSLLTDAPLSAEAAALAPGPAAHPLHPAHTPTGQLAFGVCYQGVNSSTIWRLPESGDQVAWESFEALARTAERGRFAAFFLGEGLRLREHRGVPFELDVAGRPDAQTLLAALAGVTDRIGLVA